jgi:hypothetical protein
MTYVVGSLGSRPARSGGFGGRRADQGKARREPRGKCHAVDTDTGEAACGTTGALQVFDDRPWRPDGEWCEECEELVPFD